MPASIDPLEGHAARIVLFTDTLADTNGVARFVGGLAARALETGVELHVVTSTRRAVADAGNVHNVRPRWACPMPLYRSLDLAAPSGRNVERVVESLRPGVVHVSTPGPVGLIGRRFAMARGLPLVGTYHTDFPAYAERLVGRGVCGRAASAAARRWLRWFYAPFDRVLGRSRAGLEAARSVGIDAARSEVLRAGIDTEMFHPRWRAVSVWDRFPGAGREGVKVLYVGRVSVEKGLGLLVRVWARVRERAGARGVDAQLIVVGDGPYLGTMRGALAGSDVVFTGEQRGGTLAAMYASSDLFVFPSTTDTLGQVVMEAQASGLPAIVTDRGGPAEIVADGRTGVVVPESPAADAATRWVAAITEMIVDAARRAAMSRAARERVGPMTFDASFEHFVAVHAACVRHRAPKEKPGHTLACAPARR